MMKLYILDSRHRVIHAKSTEQRAHWFGNTDQRVVKQTSFNSKGRQVDVSTVFIGIAVGAHRELFETKVWVGGEDMDTTRSDTWTEAKRIHKEKVRLWK